jgi:hypothetical protein
MIRASFSPNSPEAQAKHFMGIQADIGPWLKDYADEIAKPAVDFTLSFTKPESDGGGGIQQ